MTALTHLLELHALARAEGGKRPLKRELHQRVQVEFGKHFLGIVGPRGAGKTVLLRQLAHELPDAFYLSVDTLAPDDDLFEIVRGTQERYRFRTFLLDEVHYLPEAPAALKKLHDFLDVRVIFTSSVALAMQQSAHDLSRRVRMLTLDYFSFREYLQFSHREVLPALSLEDLLANRFSADHLRAGRHWQNYVKGGLLPFALEEPDPLPLLAGAVEKIIERDIPTTLRLRLDELPLLRRLAAFVGRSAVDGINYSSLSSNLGITKYKAEQYVAALEGAFVLQRVLPAGTNVLREPKVLLVPPLRLLHSQWDQSQGALREEFFALAMRQAGLTLHYLKGTRGQKTPDYLVQHDGRNLVLEIGGKGKGRQQFKGLAADLKLILSPDAAPEADRLPLHLVGFLRAAEPPFSGQ